MTCAMNECFAPVREPLPATRRGTLPAVVDLPLIVPAARRAESMWRWSMWSRVGASLGASAAGHVGVLAWLAVAPWAVSAHWLPVESGKASLALQASVASSPWEPAVEIELAPAQPELPPRPQPAESREPAPLPEAVAAVSVGRRLPELPTRASEPGRISPDMVGVASPRAALDARPATTPQVGAPPAASLSKTSACRDRLLTTMAPASAASAASSASRPSQGATAQIASPVYNPAPTYPPEALAARQTGRVLLHVALGPDGAVVSVELSGSSGAAALDEAAMEAVRRWRFSSDPSQPVRHIAVPVRFTIAGPATSGG